MITKILIFYYYNEDFLTIVETDFYDSVNSKLFSLFDKDELLHCVAFFSENLNLTESNNKIYDKELLTFTQYFEQ